MTATNNFASRLQTGDNFPSRKGAGRQTPLRTRVTDNASTQSRGLSCANDINWLACVATSTISDKRRAKMK